MEPHLPPPARGADVQGGRSSSASGYQLTNFERFLSFLVDNEIHHAAGFSLGMWNGEASQSIDNSAAVPNAKRYRLDQKTEEPQHGQDKPLEPDIAAGKDGPSGGHEDHNSGHRSPGATTLARRESSLGSRGVPFKADKTAGVLWTKGSLKKGVLKKCVLKKKMKDPLISDLCGVCWNKRHWRWQVDFKNRGQRLHKNFSARGNSPEDVARARKVAEDQRRSWEQEYKPHVKAVKKGHGRRAMAAKVAGVTKAVSKKLAKASKRQWALPADAKS